MTPKYRVYPRNRAYNPAVKKVIEESSGLAYWSVSSEFLGIKVLIRQRGRPLEAWRFAVQVALFLRENYEALLKEQGFSVES